MNRKIAFIGGDHRQTVALSLLSEKYETAIFGFDSYDSDIGSAVRCKSVADALKGADAVILPLPYTRDKLHIFAPLSRTEILTEEVLESLEPRSRLYGGMFDEYVTDRVRNAVDYYKNEQLQIMNAVPTAEGAIAIAMDELPVTLFESNAVVIGYGRVAKLLAHRLTALGAKVTVCARREDDRAYASAFGCNAVDFSLLGSALETADVVFNSVPQHIIGEELYPRINKNTPVIDLASRPGGLDFERAKQYGLNVIWALSRPGKAAPVTAGRIIAATLTKLLEGSENNA